MFFSELKKYKLAEDENALRDVPEYQQIRSEINRRVSPLIGGTDWEIVFKLCSLIGQRDGFDLLLAVYYTVAAVKIQGLRGLPDGLELQAAVIKHQGKDSLFPAAKRVDLFNWMIGHIASEIRALKPGITQLRELYRCERACNSLYELLSEIQPENVPDLEAIAFHIFEHIDRLEQPAVPQGKVVKVSVVNKFALACVFLLGLCLGGGGYYGWITMPRLMASVLETVQQPRILTQETGQKLIKEYGTEKLFEAREALSAIYLGAMKEAFNKPVGEKLFNAVEAGSSLQFLFPDDIDITVHNLEVKVWKQVLEDEFTAQKIRFQTARTNAANLKRFVKRGDLNSARILSESIETYALSLSPLYGRTLYIEEKLQHKDYSGAESELRKLSTSINALLFKVASIEHQLDNKF
ncbi:type VI secretion system ImpA family N-terminal domain-containing protein [Halodesulfovibrio aestuarii]|uniref:type VI secretion system ImpA family N-terminal domain-containing protein n=1 Tax=Halodesulfovibrio aestuarii TaxID=126333 RepID=UPI0004135E45